MIADPGTALQKWGQPENIVCQCSLREESSNISAGENVTVGMLITNQVVFSGKLSKAIVHSSQGAVAVPW